MKVNLNDTIKFQITEFGRKVLNKHFVKLKEHYNIPDHLIDHLKEKYSSETIEMVMWEFMNIFGNDSYCGGENYCKDNVIEICGGVT